MGDVESSSVSDEFIAWCRDHDIQTQAVAVHQFEGGERGVIATDSIEAGAVLVRAPESVLLSVRSAARDPAIQSALQSIERPSDAIVLCVHILLEASKQRDSRWSPYLRSLPTEYTILGAFPPGLEQEFQVAHAVHACEHAQSKLASDFAHARSLLDAAGVCGRFKTRAAWRWAAGVVATRTMHMPDDVVGCLTPFADMHNFCPPTAPQPPRTPVHAQHVGGDTDPRPAGHGCFDEAAGEYVVTAGRPYTCGQQVFLCYGSYTNMQLLQHYGFLLPENPHDEVELPPHVWPCATAEATGMGRAFLHPCGVPSWGLLLRLRLHFCSRAERASCGNAWQGERISVSNETKVYQCVGAACMEVLASFSTSTKKDKQLMAETDASTSLWQRCFLLVLRWRIHYKQALAKAYKHAAACTAALARH
eukprot:jgi/Ulvmu1/2984/UM015_0024.1